MPREPRISDYEVPVPGIGVFTVGRRAMKDEVAIQVEFARLVDGATPTDWLQVVCTWLALFKVLLVRVPDGWDLDTMDPQDEETYAKMGKVYEAIREQERSFRRGPGVRSEGSGAAAGGDGRI